MVDYLAAEVEAGERGGPTLARGPVGVRVNWAAISTHVRIKLKNNPNNKQTFAGQAEAIVRSAAAAAAGQDDDFVDDPEFELLGADGSDSNVGTVGRGNPGWLSAQMSSMSSSTSINYCLIKPLDR